MKIALYTLGLVVTLILLFYCPQFTDGCSTDEFQCADTQCVNLSAVCDGYNDCQDGSDEIQTSGCGSEPVPSHTGEGNDSDEVACDDTNTCTDNSNIGLGSGTIAFIVILSCYYLYAAIAGLVIVICNCGAHWGRKRVARAPTNARGTVVIATVINNESQGRTTLQTPSSTPPTDTAESLPPCPNAQDLNTTLETTFADAQFSSGVAPPTYNAAGDIKTVPSSEVDSLSNQVSGDKVTVIPIEHQNHSEFAIDCPPAYSA